MIFCIYFNQSKYIFSTFPQRVGVDIVLSIKRHQDCYFWMKTNIQITSPFNIELMKDQFNMADREVGTLPEISVFVP